MLFGGALESYPAPPQESEVQREQMVEVGDQTGWKGGARREGRGWQADAWAMKTSFIKY